MTDFPSYSTGTVAIAANATSVIGTGSNWTGLNAMSGDTLSVARFGQVKINDVTDATHLAIDAWPFGAVTAGTAYSIKKDSPLRFVGAQTAVAVDQMVTAINTNGFYVFVGSDETVPDQSLGDDGQYALKATTGQIWQKEGGVWTFVGTFKGFGTPAPWDSATAYLPFEVATLAGSSYVCVLANTNQTPPNATYWTVLASIGDTGPTGPVPLTPIAPWVTATSYVTGPPASFVSQSGSSYSCLVAHTSGTFATDLAAGKWGLVAHQGSGDLISTNNLSDLPSAQISRGNLGILDAPQGRLTLTSGTPVMATSVTAATTLYYAPMIGIYVPISSGGVMLLYDFTASANDAVGLSLALGSNWAANSNYDVFVALNGGVVTLATGPDWSAGAVAGSNAVGASVRGTGAGSTDLQICKGFLTNKNSITLRSGNSTTFTAAVNEATYLGTVRTGSAGQISFTFGSLAAGGGAANLFVWNAYNQSQVTTVVSDSTASWTYSSATVRPSNNSTKNRVNFIQGLAQGGVDASVNQVVRNPNVIGAAARVGVALNSTTIYDRNGQAGNNSTTGSSDSPVVVRMAYPPTLGANFISSNEAGDGTNTATFFGSPSAGTNFHMLVVTLPM